MSSSVFLSFDNDDFFDIGECNRLYLIGLLIVTLQATNNF